MKKSNVLILLAAGVMMLSACSNDETFSDKGSGNDQTHQIVLQVANGGDGLTTRAGRPLLSSEAKQSIENVKVIVTDSTTDQVIYQQLISDWKSASSNYGDASASGEHGRSMFITIPAEIKFTPNTTYTIYAFGYHNPTEYSDIQEKIANIAQGGTFKSNTILTTGNTVDEIFAGSYTLKAAEDKDFRANVVLHRQVAGIFTYLSNIPFYEGATQLELYASAKNKHLVLGHFANKELANNGKNTSSNVINGTQTSTSETSTSETLVYKIDLTKWFKTIKDEDEDNLIDVFEGTAGNCNNWKNPFRTDVNTATASFVQGSVFGGSFIVPFKANSRNTFELKMTDGKGKVFQTWVIKLGNGDTPFTGKGYVWNGTGNKFDENVFNDNEKVYSAFRNQLYGVGTKVSDGESTPGKPNPDPDGPDPDKNDPTPINKKHELILKVNDNWEVIHKMEIE